MKKKVVIVAMIVLALVFAQVAIGQEEVKVPFSAIKSSCYGKIDMSKAEFALAEVGEECVTEEWLEDNLPEEEAKADKNEDASKETRKEIRVPKTAVQEEKLGQLSEKQRNQVEVKVPIEWVKEGWLKEHQKEWKISLSISHMYFTGRTRVWFPIPPSYSLQQVSEVDFNLNP